MARKRDEMLGMSPAETIISAGVRIKGNLTSEGDVVIDGSLTGGIKATGNLTIGVNGVIRGDVSGANVKVAGHLDGNVNSEGETDIMETGQVKGNIKTASIQIQTGAIFIGTTTMPQTEAQTPDDRTLPERPVQL